MTAIFYEIQKCTDLSVEVEESTWTVNIVEWYEACHIAVDAHRVNPESTTRRHEQPMRIWATYKHLKHHNHHVLPHH